MTWFIDGGAHRGESIRLARTVYEPPLQFIAVEPLLECAPDLAAEGAIVIPGALWTEFGRRRLYLGSQEVSSSLMAEKTSGNIDRTRFVEVPTVTLGSILRALPDGEHVVVKLDLEGAEYDVLDQALADRDLRWVRDLYVDFHGERIAGFPLERHNALVERLLTAGWPLSKWSPIKGCVEPYGERWFMR